MPFEVSEATEADIPRIMEIQFNAWEDAPIHHAVYGDNTAETRAATGERALKAWRENPHEVLVKATNTETGEIVAFGRYRIYKTERPESEWKKRITIDWCEGRRKELVENYFGVFSDWRDRTFGGKPYCGRPMGVLFVFLDFLNKTKQNKSWSTNK